ncbi:MAG: RNA polymerase subunit sigma-24 [Hydrogenoanaerobacterium sp.]
MFALTKRELSQLYYLKREIIMQQHQLDSLKVCTEKAKAADTVKGSNAEYPYNSRIFSVDGIVNTAEYNCTKREIEELTKLIQHNREKCVIEYERLTRAIMEIDDSLMRQLLFYRYINGFSWVQVAKHIGGGNTADSVRMAHERFLHLQTK